jgi:radical SAM protein with 4Fe4S-binding SPASM domain
MLGEADGSRTIGDILAAHSAESGDRERILRLLEKLERVGVCLRGEQGLARVGRPEWNAPAPPSHGFESIRNIDVALTRKGGGFDPGVSPAAARSADELTPPQIMAFLTLALPFCSRDVQLTLLGGEPLVVAGRVLQVAWWAQRHAIRTRVKTSGGLIDERFAARAGKLDLEVCVTMCGCSEATHDSICGRESFERALAGVRKLVSNEVRVALSVICFEKTVKELSGCFELAEKLGAHAVRLELPATSTAPRAEEMKEAGPLEIAREVLGASERYAAARDLLARATARLASGDCALLAAGSSCGTGRTTVLLDAEGSVYACRGLCAPELRLGNIHQAGFDFHELWTESSEMADLRGRTEMGEGKCAGCVIRRWCLGGCRGSAYDETGDLSCVPGDCRERERAILELMWHVERE